MRHRIKNAHVVLKNGQWTIKLEGVKTHKGIFDTQKEAIVSARRLAIKNHSELLIHGRNGSIRARNSYGHDPRNVKG